MQIVSESPATCTNMLFANRAATARGSALFLPLGRRPFISLLPEAHFAVLRSLTNIHTYCCAFHRACPLTTFVNNRSTLITRMLYPTRVPIDTKEAPFAITWHKPTDPHIIWMLHFIPVQADTIIQQINTQVNLKIRASSVFVLIFFPARLSDSVVLAINNHNEECVHHTIQDPAKDANVVSVGSYTG